MRRDGLSRRSFLALVVAGAAAACTGDDGGSTSGDTAGARSGDASPGTTPGTVPPATFLQTDPFTLGVASGDPTPSAVILWTRLATDPLGGGGLPDDAITVLAELATDEAFTDVVWSATPEATPTFGHSVHVDATGLDADTWYWYRFRVGAFTSPTGRTRTAPGTDALPAGGRVRVGFGSCQNWQSGYYTAYPHLVDEDLDLMLWLGDYIYEGGVSDTGVRRHDGPEVTDLTAYRNRYALYRSDPALQAAHAACPWVVTWDDHEVDNDYAGLASEDAAPIEEFASRRAQAYQAFYEHMPVRIDPPDDEGADLHRDVPWGRLATFFVLDGRQHRTDQPCAVEGQTQSFGAPCGEEDDPANTMLGAEQKGWLLEGLRSSTARWDVLANQTVMTRLPIAGGIFNFDQWDGYTAERAEILETAAARDAGNLLVVTGDIHAFGVGVVQAEADGPALGTEFVGGAISSQFPAAVADLVQDSVSALPQIAFADTADNGYGVLELTEGTATCTLRAVSTTATPEADVQTLGTWVVDDGTPGPRPS
jgi:alkaline phosphatase D